MVGACPAREQAAIACGARSYKKLKNLATFGRSSKLRYARFDMI